jgi:hypothetical protein
MFFVDIVDDGDEGVATVTVTGCNGGSLAFK